MDSIVSCRVEHWLISTVCCSGVRLSNSLLKTVRKSSTYRLRTRKFPADAWPFLKKPVCSWDRLDLIESSSFSVRLPESVRRISPNWIQGEMRFAWIWNIFHTLFYLYNEILDRSLRQSYHLLALLKSETKSAADLRLPQEGLSRWPTPYSIQANLRSF